MQLIAIKVEEMAIKIMITRQYIGKKLKIFRKSKGLNQQEMADAIGISRAALSTWEKGEKVPNLMSILQISMTYTLNG